MLKNEKHSILLAPVIMVDPGKPSILSFFILFFPPH